MIRRLGFFIIIFEIKGDDWSNLYPGSREIRLDETNWAVPVWVT
jgi:hypothetical protein